MLRSCILDGNCATRQRHLAPPMHVSSAMSLLHPSTVRIGQPARLTAARAADSGDNGVPTLDDAEAAPIPLVPEAAAASSPGPLLAVGAVAVGAAVFFATRLGTGSASFDTLASDAMPLSSALANHRPSVIEFYASWYVSLFAFAIEITQSHI